MHIRDTGADQISEVNLLVLINDAAQEASNSAWWIPIEDSETLTLVDDTHEYAVPATFAAIKELRLGTNFDTIIARHYWQMRINGGVAVFSLEPSWQVTYTAGNLKVVGWQRPNVSYSVGNTIDPGLESFIRERAAAHALAYMAAGMSELDRFRQSGSEIKKRDSEAFLARRPEQFEILPLARYVPGR